MHWRAGVVGDIQVIAQGGAQRWLVTRFDADGVDQRRSQIVFADFE